MSAYFSPPRISKTFDFGEVTSSYTIRVCHTRPVFWRSHSNGWDQGGIRTPLPATNCSASAGAASAAFVSAGSVWTAGRFRGISVGSWSGWLASSRVSTLGPSGLPPCRGRGSPAKPGAGPPGGWGPPQKLGCFESKPTPGPLAQRGGPAQTCPPSPLGGLLKKKEARLGTARGGFGCVQGGGVKPLVDVLLLTTCAHGRQAETSTQMQW